MQGVGSDVGAEYSVDGCQRLTVRVKHGRELSRRAHLAVSEDHHRSPCVVPNTPL